MQDEIIDINQSVKIQSGISIHRVGMDGIDLPIAVEADGQPTQCMARVNAHVSLDNPSAKGIHMSRLYLLVQEFLSSQTITAKRLRHMLSGFVTSHATLSESASVQLAFDMPLERRSLLSNKLGWKTYPVRLAANLEGDRFHLLAGIEVAYSSTCPCSAALSRQLIQKKFAEDFVEGAREPSREAILEWLGKETSILATPHGQRSKAQVSILADDRLDPIDELVGLVDRLESGLGTPVQTVVKREDEQEFARLNGANLMFSEDAARRVQRVLAETKGIQAFKAKVSHFESLHPHDAVAIVTSDAWHEATGTAKIENLWDT